MEVVLMEQQLVYHLREYHCDIYYHNSLYIPRKVLLMDVKYRMNANFYLHSLLSEEISKFPYWRTITCTLKI